MTRIAALMLALGLMAGGVSTLDATAAPQAPKKDDKKKDDKKAEKKTETAAAVGKIEIYKGKKGFRWRMRDADDKIVAIPLPQAAWESKEDVEKALNELKETLNKAKPVDARE